MLNCTNDSIGEDGRVILHADERLLAGTKQSACGQVLQLKFVWVMLSSFRKRDTLRSYEICAGLYSNYCLELHVLRETALILSKRGWLTLAST